MDQQGPPARDAAGGSQKLQRVRIASPRQSHSDRGAGQPGAPEPTSPGFSAAPPMAAREPTLMSDRLRAVRAPAAAVNMSLVQEAHGSRCWQYSFLLVQRTRGYTLAFVTLLLLDVCAAITVLLLNTSYPECATVTQLARCEANVTLPAGVSVQPACDENQAARAAGAVLAVFSLITLSIFLTEVLILLAALWNCLPRTGLTFRLLLFTDIFVLSFALGIELYLLSVGYQTAGERGLQASSPMLVLISRGYRYIQLARRSYAIIGRVTRSNSGSAKSVLEKKAEIDHELEGYREQQLLARVEDTGRVHPSKLVLQVCADMLNTVQQASSTPAWAGMRELAAAAGIAQFDVYVDRILKRRLKPLYSHGDEWYHDDSNLAHALFQAVTIKKSMAAWPDGLMALLDDGATPLRELFIVDKLNVSLDHLGPGGYGPLALLVRVSSRLVHLAVRCASQELWLSSGKDAFIEAVAASASLREINFSDASLPPLLCSRLCQRLAARELGVGLVLGVRLAADADDGDSGDLESLSPDEERDTTAAPWDADRDLHYGRTPHATPNSRMSPTSASRPGNRPWGSAATDSPAEGKAGAMESNAWRTVLRALRSGGRTSVRRQSLPQDVTAIGRGVGAWLRQGVQEQHAVGEKPVDAESGDGGGRGPTQPEEGSGRRADGGAGREAPAPPASLALAEVSQIGAISFSDNELAGCGRDLSLLLTECSALRELDLSRTSLTMEDGAQILAGVVVRLGMDSAADGLAKTAGEGVPPASHATGEGVAASLPAAPPSESGYAAPPARPRHRPLECVILDAASLPESMLGNLPPSVAAVKGDALIGRAGLAEILKEVARCVAEEEDHADDSDEGELGPAELGAAHGGGAGGGGGGGGTVGGGGTGEVTGCGAGACASSVVTISNCNGGWAVGVGASTGDGGAVGVGMASAPPPPKPAKKPKKAQPHWNRFSGDGKADLHTGTLIEAARGLQHYMNVTSAHIHAGVTRGTQAIVEEVHALGDAEAIALLDYILYEPASEALYPNGIRDLGRNGERLADFCRHPNAVWAGLDEAHVVALRLYTTKVFSHINAPLRKPQGAHPLARTTWFISEAILRLRTVHARAGYTGATEDLWRGMRNLRLTDSFMAHRTGGTELAPMSTSTSLAVAAAYGASSGTLLFKIKVDNAMVRGASLGWLSAFPSEAEVLFPPLTYLQPTGLRQTVYLGKATFEIVEVQPNLSS